MDSLSPKSAELTQLARNQLLIEQNLKNTGVTPSPRRQRNAFGIVGRSFRFVFSLIPDFLLAKKRTRRENLMRQHRRRAKV